MNPRATAIKLILGVFLTVLATAPRLVWVADGEEACAAATGILRYGKPLVSISDVKSPDLSQFAKLDGIEPRELVPSMRPFLFTMSCLPTAFAAIRLRLEDTRYTSLLKAILPASWGALTTGLFFLLLIGSNCRHDVAFWTSLAMLFSSPLWMYARIHYSDGLQILLLVAIGYFLVSRESAPRSNYTAAGLLAGLLFLGRATNILVMIPVAGHLLFHQRTPMAKKTQLAVRFIAGFAPCVAAWLFYNQVRFGGWLVSGYEHMMVWTSPWRGLYGNFFSPGKSIFLYAPLAAMGFIAFLKRHDKFNPRSFAFHGFLFVATMLAVHSSYWAWHSDRSWGPRLNLMILPFLFLAAAKWLSAPDRGNAATRFAIALGLAGVALQIPVTILGTGILYQYLGYADMAAFKTRTTPFSIADDLILSHYVPDFSPLVMQFHVLSKMLAHGSDFVMDFAGWAGSTGEYRIPGFEGPTIPFTGIRPDFWFWPAIGQDFDGFSTLAAAIMLGAGVVLIARAHDSIKEKTSGPLQERWL